jgi:hypothetical protein
VVRLNVSANVAGVAVRGATIAPQLVHACGQVQRDGNPYAYGMQVVCEREMRAAKMMARENYI